MGLETPERPDLPADKREWRKRAVLSRFLLGYRHALAGHRRAAMVITCLHFALIIAFCYFAWRSQLALAFVACLSSVALQCLAPVHLAWAQRRAGHT